ncbi:hypothetical protein [Enterococcus phage GVEsP-1]|uniref:Uncharacterized protein n=1 Tax=Enterococcus phage GVEsP-1 TaxID=2859564 RepID=A0ABX8WTC2_9CAUD|nr:hypothetical protein [Enterococcus phage GVEsP-1]
MSEMETRVGKVRKLTEVEQYQVVSLFTQSRGERPSYYDSDMEWFLEENYDSYVKVGDDLYHAVEQTILDNDEVSLLTPVEGEPDLYNFLFTFYNGGTCFSEMLADAIKREKKS